MGKETKELARKKQITVSAVWLFPLDKLVMKEEGQDAWDRAESWPAWWESGPWSPLKCGWPESQPFGPGPEYSPPTSFISEAAEAVRGEGVWPEPPMGGSTEEEALREHNLEWNN